MPTDREMILDEEIRSDYLWCLHCWRTYKRGEYRVEGSLQMCPYEGCGGDTVIDAWDWADIRDAHPEYPEKPEQGESYDPY